jgi:type II secretory pathway component PulC
MLLGNVIRWGYMIASPLRKNLFVNLFFILSAILSSTYSTITYSAMLSAEQPLDNKFNQQTYEIGQMVQALQSAIKTPEQHESFLIIMTYGSDKRYHAMIRGWLFEALVTVERQLYASQNVKQKNILQLKSDALKKAIRLINTD